MNATDNLTSDCNPLGFYGPGESPVPEALLWVALVDYYCVIVFGTLGKPLASHLVEATRHSTLYVPECYKGEDTDQLVIVSLLCFR